jgi:hypothetical protein
MAKTSAAHLSRFVRVFKRLFVFVRALNRIYGDDYMTVAYQELDHANNRPIDKVICRVKDREPAQAIVDEIPYCTSL